MSNNFSRVLFSIVMQIIPWFPAQPCTSNNTDFNFTGTAPITTHDANVDGGVPFFSVRSQKNVQFVLVLPANIAVLAFHPIGLLSSAFPLNPQCKVTASEHFTELTKLTRITKEHHSRKRMKEIRTEFMKARAWSGRREPKISVNPRQPVQDTRDLASPFNQPLGREIWVCRTRHSNASFIWFQSPLLPWKVDGNFFTGKKKQRKGLVE